MVCSQQKSLLFLTLVSNSNQVSSKSFCAAAAPSLIQMLWVWDLRILGRSRRQSSTLGLAWHAQGWSPVRALGGEKPENPPGVYNSHPVPQAVWGPCERETCSLGSSETVRKTKICRLDPLSSVISEALSGRLPGDSEKPQSCQAGVDSISNRVMDGTAL